MLLAVTAATHQAERQLRDPTHFQWYAVTLLVLVIYAYATEIERGRLDVVAAGLALWLADWINELLNSAILHISGQAALWTETGSTAYQILVGLNLETTMMFALGGLAFAKVLRPVRASQPPRLLRAPDRLLYGVAFSLLAVGVEVLLHEMGVLHWHYWWWNGPFVLPIIVFGYLWFFLAAAIVHDRPDERSRWAMVGTLAGVAGAPARGFVLAGWLFMVDCARRCLR